MVGEGPEVPEPVYQDELATVYLADALRVLAQLPDAGVEALVTDPPAGIAFMGEGWDTFSTRPRHRGTTFPDAQPRPGTTHSHEHRPGAREAFIGWMTAIACECLRVLKPGGHGVVWAIPRTSHWTATALEAAGFEVRDVIHHLFGQGFPKSRNLSGEWDGWGTGLKPAAEHWILVRRPLQEPTVEANVLRFRTGALNMDGCRVPGAAGGDRDGELSAERRYAEEPGDFAMTPGPRGGDSRGRWPANLVLTHASGCRPVGTARVPTGTAVRRRGVAGGQVYSRGRWGHKPGTPNATYATEDGLEVVEASECVEGGCPVGELDGQAGMPTSCANPARRGSDKARHVYGDLEGQTECDPVRGADSGGASRFFPTFRYEAKAAVAERNRGLTLATRNGHPTVKPLDLMRWLVRLVTPPGGLVLDPFAGSGTTLVAAKLEGFRAIGIERDPEAVDICWRRLAWATHQPALFTDEEEGREMPD